MLDSEERQRIGICRKLSWKSAGFSCPIISAKTEIPNGQNAQEVKKELARVHGHQRPRFQPGFEGEKGGVAINGTADIQTAAQVDISEAEDARDVSPRWRACRATTGMSI